MGLFDIAMKNRLNITPNMSIFFLIGLRCIQQCLNIVRLNIIVTIYKQEVFPFCLQDATVAGRRNASVWLVDSEYSAVLLRISITQFLAPIR